MRRIANKIQILHLRAHANTRVDQEVNGISNEMKGIFLTKIFKHSPSEHENMVLATFCVYLACRHMRSFLRILVWKSLRANTRVNQEVKFWMKWNAYFWIFFQHSLYGFVNRASATFCVYLAWRYRRSFLRILVLKSLRTVFINACHAGIKIFQLPGLSNLSLHVSD